MIEFQMNPTKKNYIGASVSLLIRNKVFIAFSIFLLSSLLVIELVANIYPDTEKIVGKLGAIILIVFSLPFALSMGFGKLKYKYNKEIENKIYFMTTEGYGVKYGQNTTFFFDWQQYQFIKEIPNYIFLKTKTGQYHTIYKNCISKEKLLNIKSILAKTTIEKKYLLDS